MRKFRNKITGDVFEVTGECNIDMTRYEELTDEPQPCWWYRNLITGFNQWQQPICHLEIINTEEGRERWSKIGWEFHFGPTPPQDEIILTSPKDGTPVKADDSYGSENTTKYIIDKAKNLEPESSPIPYNEFDFRHLRGCPQSVFRPGDRCSCNVALREYVMFHNSYRSANDSDITRRWMDKISEEITCDTTRIDLDFDPNVGELKQ